MEPVMKEILANKMNENGSKSLISLKVADSIKRKSMIGFIFDLPNVCTLFGLFSALLGIYFAIQNLLYFAVICGAWAVLFDLLDGSIARKMKSRSSDDRDFGGRSTRLLTL